MPTRTHASTLASSPDFVDSLKLSVPTLILIHDMRCSLIIHALASLVATHLLIDYRKALLISSVSILGRRHPRHIIIAASLPIDVSGACHSQHEQN